MRTRNGVLLSVDNSDLTNGHFTVPEGITTINKNAFTAADELTSLRLSKELKYIDNLGLCGLDRLRELDIPNCRIHFDACRLDCPNLEKVSIDGSSPDLSNGVLSLLINRNLKSIEFYFMGKSIEYPLKNKISTIFKVKDNRFILVENGAELQAVGAIIDEKYVERFNYPKLCKMFNYDSFENFMNDYEYALDYRYDLMYDWGRIISKFSDKNRGYYPAQSAVLAIPATKKDIYKYFLHQKKFHSYLNAHFSDDDDERRIAFTKMAYLFGVFEDDDATRKRAYKTIDDILQKHHFYEMRYHFDMINMDMHGYDPDFKDYLTNNWEEIFSTLNDSNYTVLNSVFQEFGNCKRQARRDKKELTPDYVNAYVAANRFNVREGNEGLLNAVKEYHAEYSKDDFNKLQDLFEKAREISISSTKKIITTVDNEKKDGNCYYKWLSPTDPANYVLGNKVGCCARINSVGQGILSESVLNPEVRNLALFGHKNKIIGKATAYFNTKNKYILFNNAEISESIQDEEKEELLEALLRAVSDQVAIQNKDKLNVEKVAIGMTRNDLKHQIFKKRLKIVRVGLLKNNPGYAENTYLYEGDANDITQGQCILYHTPKSKRRFF